MMKITFLTLVLFILHLANIFGQKGFVNPAAKYCKMLGYKYEITTEKDGDEIGICILPNGKRVNAWDFYKGKVAKEFSYAAKLGFDIETEVIKKNGYTIERPVCVRVTKGVGERIPLLEFMEINGEPLILTEGKSATALYDMAKKDANFKVVKSLPTSFDWRDKDGHSYIGPIQNQGDCDACYAFAAAACAEGAYNYCTGNYDSNVTDFSESYIAWCLGSMSQYSSHFGGCGGADYDYYELQALVDIGIIKESYFPYSDNYNQVCPISTNSAPKTQFKSWHRVTCSDADAIKTAIMSYGVVDAAVYVTTSFQDYSGGIFSDNYNTCNTSPCYNAITNHSIALVGWGHDATEGDYWILRNSWGSSWGENGYMRISVNSAHVDCAVCYMVYTYISGPTTVCTSNSTFTLNNPPPGATVNWTKSSNLSYVSGQGTNNYTVKAVSSSTSGAGWVEAEISVTGCGDITVSKDFWVGVPDVNNINLISHSHSLNPPIKVNLNSTHSYYASLWDNSVDDGEYFKWQVWGGTANHSTGPFNVIKYNLRGNAFLEISRVNTCGESIKKTYTINVSIGGGNPRYGDPIGGFELSIQPNPANDYIEAEIQDDNFEPGGNNNINIKLFNNRSIPVYTGNSHQKTFRINTGNLPHGLYLLQIIYNGEKYSKQVLIEH